MRVDEVVRRMGGVAGARALVDCTSRGKVRSALRRGEIVRIGRGRYALPTAQEALRAASRVNGTFSGLSAALYYGWKVKTPPQLPTVTVPRNRNVSPERREGIDLKWRNIPPEHITKHGVTSKAWTVIDCARTHPFDEALAVADSAIRNGDVSGAELLELAEQVPSTGRTQCVRVARAADGRAANPFEFHGKRRALYEDCERYNAFAMKGWWVIRFSWEHVMFEPDYVRDVLTRMVGLLSAQPSAKRASAQRKAQRRSA